MIGLEPILGTRCDAYKAMQCYFPTLTLLLTYESFYQLNYTVNLIQILFNPIIPRNNIRVIT